MSYNLVEEDKDEFQCQETLGLIEFLRRAEKNEELSYSVRVLGLDALLAGAQDQTETATTIRNFLANHNEFLARRNPMLVFPIRGTLEEAGAPRMFVLGERIDLSALFGNRLERVSRHQFRAGFNLTRGS